MRTTDVIHPPFNARTSRSDSWASSSSSSSSDDLEHALRLPLRRFSTYSSTLAALARPGASLLPSFDRVCTRLQSLTTLCGSVYRSTGGRRVPSGGHQLVCQRQTRSVERRLQVEQEARLTRTKPTCIGGAFSHTFPYPSPSSSTLLK